MREFEVRLKERRLGDIVRLKIEPSMDEDLRAFIVRELEADARDVIVVDGMLGLTSLSTLVHEERPDLKFPRYEPRSPERIRDFGGDSFAAIRAKDILVHHPYESFDSVVQFMRQAAADPAVVAIKQTRLSDVERFADRRRAGRGRRSGQERHRADRDQGALRRRSQHASSADAGARRRLGRLRLHRLQDPREGEPGGAPRSSTGLRTYTHFGTGNYHPITARDLPGSLAVHL